MPSAKIGFIERIRSLEKSINIDAVTSKALTEIEHNRIATILRNGLAVVGFASLEDFIKGRSSEVMDEIGRTDVSFENLPEKLQFAATYDAINALNYQLSIRDKNSKIPYIQEHAVKIASTSTANYEITPHAFAYSQANVNAETIKQILQSFHIKDPWRKMSSIASRLNLTALPLEVSFKNASTRRHKAAHVATADTPQIDISQFVKEAFAIAITFDCLLSKALKKIKNNDSRYLSGDALIVPEEIKFRTLKHIDNKWKEINEGSLRAYRTSHDINLLKPDTKRRAATSNQLYIEFDINGLINDWECN